MSDNGRPRLTLNERLALASQSKAASPQAALALVRRFAGIPAAYVFCGGDDVNLMNELTGEFWEDPRVDVDSYRGFCPSFLVAMEQGGEPLSLSPEETDLGRPRWGARVNNALVLLGEMLLDSAMDRWHFKEVYHCTRMTLGQYLEALAAPDFRRSKLEAESFTAWRERLLDEAGGDRPLAEALAGILRRYIAGWERLARLDHVLRCLGGLARHIEEEGTVYKLTPCPEGEFEEGEASLIMHVSRTQSAEEAFRCLTLLRRIGVWSLLDDLPQAPPECPDPLGYFLELAREGAPAPPDPSGEMKAKALREQIFLPDWRYGFGVLRDKIAEKLPCPEFKELLDECLDREELPRAMGEVNRAVTDIFMLWVEPYLRL